MGLRINQNIAAMNAARNLRKTDGAMSKSLERLSSGFRINRASDDPAGLIISENLRAQVSGLGQAIKNSQNAVNVIKTAEAALDEVLKQLRSIRTLALDALNTGASDAVARAADQTQIDSSIQSINRIGNTTQFGKLNLLNGTAGVVGSTDNANLTFISGSVNTKSGTYDVDVTSLATRGSNTFSSISNEYELTGGAAATMGGAVNFTLDFGNVDNADLTASQTANLGALLAEAGVASDTSQAGVTITFTEADAQVSVAIDTTDANVNTFAEVVTALNATSLGNVVNISDDGDSGGNAGAFQISSSYAGLGFAAISNTNSGITDGSDAAAVQDLGDGIVAGGAAQGAAAIKVFAETLTFNGVDTVSIATGTLLTNVASTINNALSGTGTKVTASFTADTDNGTSTNSDLTIQNVDFGSANPTTLTSNKDGSVAHHLTIGTGSTTIQGTDIVGTINGIAATGFGQTLSLSSPGNDADGLSFKYSGATTATGIKATVSNNSLQFQVGANSGQTVKQSLTDTRANKLGLAATGLVTSAKSVADIDVTTVNGANDALALVDAAINDVTTVRGNLGAFQANILESSIESLGVTRENLAAAESSIRDADFAEETVMFTRNQILLQAGTSILTQANTIPQSVLQLLQ